MKISHKELWEKILRQLSTEITRPNLITWFRNTTILRIEENALIVGLPREIFQAWHYENSRQKIKKILLTLEPNIKKVDFIIDGSLENKDDPRVLDLIKLFPDPNKAKKRKAPKILESKISGGILSRQLNKKFTLASFIVGPETRLAHAASESVATHPGGKYNPLFIYGGVGLGKTHLLNAIGNDILKNNPHWLVAFVSAENFVAEFIESVRNQKADKFRDKWKKVHVLIVDDIQFLAGKEKTEEIFFHVFNDLYDSGRQIVVSSDKPPSQLKEMTSRLVSRFSMGMIADLQFPSLETRMAIIQQKSQDLGVVLDLNIIQFIAQNIHRSIREIEGILTQIVAKIDLEGELPNRTNISDIIRRVNKDLRINTLHFEQLTSAARTMRDITEKVAEYYAVTLNEVVGSNRSREYLIPRQISMWFCKKKLKYSYQKIGNFFGGRDHTSVMNSVKKVEKLKKIDKEFWRNVNTLRKELGF